MKQLKSIYFCIRVVQVQHDTCYWIQLFVSRGVPQKGASSPLFVTLSELILKTPFARVKTCYIWATVITLDLRSRYIKSSLRQVKICYVHILAAWSINEERHVVYCKEFVCYLLSD